MSGKPADESDEAQVAADATGPEASQAHQESGAPTSEDPGGGSEASGASGEHETPGASEKPGKPGESGNPDKPGAKIGRAHV